jgi:hypothetical protein
MFSKNDKMAKRKITIIIILVTVVAGLITFLTIKGLKQKKENPVCEGIDGGSFVVTYKANMGEDPVRSSVCIGCAPDTYEALPKPEKTGSIFDGWYYDEKFNRKVEGTTTLDIKPVENTREGCRIAYKDVLLYAKWVDKETNK